MVSAVCLSISISNEQFVVLLVVSDTFPLQIYVCLAFFKSVLARSHAALLAAFWWPNHFTFCVSYCHTID